MDPERYLDNARREFRRSKDLSDGAMDQLDAEQLFVTLGEDENSIAIIMKHMAGNMFSRWRDFLTTDGEKRDRQRESEFRAEGESRAEIESVWQEGWRIALEELASLEPSDLTHAITIRGEPMSVVQAIHRNLNHVVSHTGQLLQLARHLTGDAWKTLSIAPGKSDEHNAAMRAKYGDWWAAEHDRE